MKISQWAGKNFFGIIIMESLIIDPCFSVFNIVLTQKHSNSSWNLACGILFLVYMKLMQYDTHKKLKQFILDLQTLSAFFLNYIAQRLEQFKENFQISPVLLILNLKEDSHSNCWTIWKLFNLFFSISLFAIRANFLNPEPSWFL